MNNKIEVTFVFNDEESFRKFVKKNCNDEYMYKKGRYIVDMTTEVKSEVAEVSEPIVETTTTTSDDLPPPETSSGSMF